VPRACRAEAIRGKNFAEIEVGRESNGLQRSRDYLDYWIDQIKGKDARKMSNRKKVELCEIGVVHQGSN